MITPEQRQTAIEAGQTFSNLEFLTKREEFQEFIAKHRRIAEGLADQILNDDNLTHEERDALRHRRKGILEVIYSPAIDMLTARKITESIYGPGGGPD